MNFFGTIDTSRAVGNARVSVDGDAVTRDGQVMEQHFLPGDGPRSEPVKASALFIDRLVSVLVRDGEKWRISRLAADDFRFRGNNPGVITAIADKSPPQRTSFRSRL